MKITRENYESYFLDYLEGNLSPSLEAELDDFLRNNPDLSIELKDYDPVSIPVRETVFPDKELLRDPLAEKLDDPAEQFPVFALAFHEGDLTPGEDRLLEEYLRKNPGKQKDLESYGKLFLRPLANSGYPQKEKLKKPISGYIRMKPRLAFLSAAASLAMLIASYFIFMYAPSGTEYTARAQVDTLRMKRPAPVIPVSKPADSSGINRQTVNPILPERKNPAQGSVKNSGINIQLASHPEEPTANPSLVLTPAPRKDIRMLAQVLPDQQLANIQNHTGSEVSNEPVTLTEKAVYRFKKSVLGEPEEVIRPDRFSLWDIADAGIRGINGMTGWDMKLEKEYDEDGRISYLAFDSRAVQVAHTPKK